MPHYTVPSRLIRPRGEAIAAGPQFAFSVFVDGRLDELLGLVIAFAASGRITGARNSCPAPSATGTGVVTVVEDLCLGGTFGATPLDCSGSQAISRHRAADSGPQPRTRE